MALICQITGCRDAPVGDWLVGEAIVGATYQGPVVVKCCLGLKCIGMLKREQELWFVFHIYYNFFLSRSFPRHLFQQLATSRSL